jgi:hypothetical protein
MKRPGNRESIWTHSEAMGRPELNFWAEGIGIAVKRGKCNAMRTSGERRVIDGPCLSACTLFTGLLLHDHGHSRPF